MKKIGFVLKGYPRVSETFIAQEIYLLEQMGFQIEIFSMRKAREPERQPIVDLIQAPITYIPEYIWREPGSVFRQNLKAFARRPLRYTRVLAQAAWRALITRQDDPLKRFLQAGWLVGRRGLNERGDIAHLHSHFIHAPTEMTTYISALSGLKYSISAHAKDIYTIPPERVVERVNRSQLIMTCTVFNYEFLKTLPGIRREKIHRVYHGVDLEKFKPRVPRAYDDAFTAGLTSFVSVGRLVPKKGYDLILKALAALKADGLDFRYEIFGEGELYGALTAQVIELGLQERVTFHRTATHPQIIQRLQSSALFLMGSRQTEDLDRDGIPNTIAEAMAMEIPVIAAKVSGIPELIVDAESGFLFREGDADDLKRVIRHALANPQQTFQVAKEGRRKVEKVFNSKVWIGDCARLLQPFCGGVTQPAHTHTRLQEATP